ncbi:MAG: ABC1 kinase family protein [Anaerolineae bacterium]
MAPQTSLNRARYRKIVWFFATIFIHIIWWDLLLRKIPLIKGRARATALRRWRHIARRFRGLAVGMGGVLIKLGQFLSTRVDVLPLEVTSELANLQDEVPPAPIDAVVALVEADFGRSIEQVFASFAPEPIAAASLAQTHRATLKDGREVVVKVQRPGIDVLVSTDLAAIEVAIRWLKFYPRVSRRVNLNWLAEEFTTVTSRELDFEAEGKNAERFQANFEGDETVYIPQIYWKYSTGRVLTMENVAYIRIADLEAIDAAGISRAEVAKKLYNVYMRQIFVTFFVHADPHPGNLFIKPLPRPEGLQPWEPTPFQVVFVDFGMVVTIPERLRSALRNYAIGIGTRDAHRVVQSYVEAGTLLPGADLKRLEEAHEAIFDHFWGVGMTQMRNLAMSEAPYLLSEYRDLIYEAPFQLQVDMLFAARAVGILSGLATGLDPHFNPWAQTIPFAERLAREEFQQNWQGWAQQLLTIFRIALELSPKLDKVLTQAQRGSLSFETSLAPDARKAMGRLETSVQRLTWAVVSVGVLLSGIILRAAEGPDPLNTGLVIASVGVFVWKVLR